LRFTTLFPDVIKVEYHTTLLILLSQFLTQIMTYNLLRMFKLNIKNYLLKEGVKNENDFVMQEEEQSFNSRWHGF